MQTADFHEMLVSEEVTFFAILKINFSLGKLSLPSSGDLHYVRVAHSVLQGTS